MIGKTLLSIVNSNLLLCRAAFLFEHNIVSSPCIFSFSIPLFSTHFSSYLLSDLLFVHWHGAVVMAQRALPCCVMPCSFVFHLYPHIRRLQRVCLFSFVFFHFLFSCLLFSSTISGVDLGQKAVHSYRLLSPHGLATLGQGLLF